MPLCPSIIGPFFPFKLHRQYATIVHIVFLAILPLSETYRRLAEKSEYSLKKYMSSLQTPDGTNECGTHKICTFCIVFYPLTHVNIFIVSYKSTIVHQASCNIPKSFELCTLLPLLSRSIFKRLTKQKFDLITEPSYGEICVLGAEARI